MTDRHKKYPDEQTKQQILEDAWERVATGDVNATVETLPSNIKMFDYPRYTWDELHDLIKGIKR